MDLSKYRLTHNWFSNSELHLRLKEFCDPATPHKILEIGSYEGLSACFFSDCFLNHPDSTLDAVDPFDLADTTTPLTSETEAIFHHNIQASTNAAKCRHHRMFSTDFFKQLGSVPTYDIIYVDGSHLYEDVLRDSESAFSVLLPGGILWFDDYGGGDGQIRRAIDTFCQAHASELEIINQWYQFAVRKK